MQTFLPLNNFEESARVLDDLRLNKQIVEAGQILKNLRTPEGERDIWKNHPAVLMWEDHVYALEEYIKRLCEEWWKRGKLGHSLLYDSIITLDEPIYLPKWFNDPLFHASHRSNLLLKDDFYKQYNWNELNQLYIPYLWYTYYSNWEEKIFTKEGIISLIKAIKRRNLWKEDHFQWPGSYPEWGIYLGSSTLGSSPYSK
jgi:hypothetical protein